MSAEKKAHSPFHSKKARLTFCKKCGLVYLKNDATKRALNKACPDDINPID